MPDKPESIADSDLAHSTQADADELESQDRSAMLNAHRDSDLAVLRSALSQLALHEPWRSLRVRGDAPLPSPWLRRCMTDQTPHVKPMIEFTLVIHLNVALSRHHLNRR